MGQSCTVYKSKLKQRRMGTFFVEYLNTDEFGQKYVAGKKLAPKVLQIKQKLSNVVYVAYRLAKENVPCRDPEKITTLCRTLINLEHPNICRLYEAFDDDWCLYLVYEQVGGKTLFEQLKKNGKITERICASVLCQVSNALSNALNLGIVHGALHPKNMLLSNNGTLEVTDVGLAGTLKSYVIDNVTKDTYNFLAPEIVEPWFRKQGKQWYSRNKKVNLTLEEKNTNSSAADMWSLGVILYNMVCATMPFVGKDLCGLAERIIEGKPAKAASAELQNVLSAMLKRDPAQRISFKALLETPWVRHAESAPDVSIGEDICKHLGSIHAETHFKKMMMRIISSKVPSRKVGDLVQSFQALDSNQDGLITLQELKDGLSKFPNLLGEFESEVHQIFKEIDHNNSGTISIEEFLGATIDAKKDVMTSVLWDAFNSFDTDRNGVLTLQELEEIVRTLEGQIGEEHVEMMIHLLEEEVKDSLTFEEFRQMMIDEGQRTEGTKALLKDGLPACSKLRRSCRQVIRVGGRASTNTPTSTPQSKSTGNQLSPVAGGRASTRSPH